MAAHPESGWWCRPHLHVGVRLARRIQDGVERTQSVGEFPRQVPHAVAALLQLHMPPVVLLVVVEGFGAVRVGSINHA